MTPLSQKCNTYLFSISMKLENLLKLVSMLSGSSQPYLYSTIYFGNNGTGHFQISITKVGIPQATIIPTVTSLLHSEHRPGNINTE